MITGAAGITPDSLTFAAPAQPKGMGATVIARAVQRPTASGPMSIALSNDADIPSDANLTVSLRADKGMRFTGKETIEIAAPGSGVGTATLPAPMA